MDRTAVQGDILLNIEIIIKLISILKDSLPPDRRVLLETLEGRYVEVKKRVEPLGLQDPQEIMLFAYWMGIWQGLNQELKIILDTISPAIFYQ